MSLVGVLIRLLVHRGYIKVWRKIEDWEWANDTQTLGFFIYLMLKANFKDSKYMSYDIPRGSLVCGRKSLSEQLGIGEQTVRTLLTRLKSTNEITIKVTSKFSIVSIANYDKYQNNSTSISTNNLTTDQPATNQQLTTSKEGNKVRKERIHTVFSEGFLSIWKDYPSKIGSQRAFEKFKASVKTPEDLVSIQTALKNYKSHLSTNDWKKPQNGATWFGQWHDWVDFKDTPTSAAQKMKRLLDDKNYQ